MLVWPTDHWYNDERLIEFNSCIAPYLLSILLRFLALLFLFAFAYSKRNLSFPSSPFSLVSLSSSCCLQSFVRSPQCRVPLCHESRLPLFSTALAALHKSLFAVARAQRSLHLLNSFLSPLAEPHVEDLASTQISPRRRRRPHMISPPRSPGEDVRPLRPPPLSLVQHGTLTMLR